MPKDTQHIYHERFQFIGKERNWTRGTERNAFLSCRGIHGTPKLSHPRVHDQEGTCSTRPVLGEST
jgi:hypothetical protein